jgi:hypothetical protein
LVGIERSWPRKLGLLMRQSAIVDIKVRIEDRLSLGAGKGRLGLDPFAWLLLFRIGEKPRFEILHDVRVISGHFSRLAGVRGEVKKLRLAGEQRDLDEFPVALANRTSEGLHIDLHVFVGARLSFSESFLAVLADERMVGTAVAAS